MVRVMFSLFWVLLGLISIKYYTLEVAPITKEDLAFWVCIMISQIIGWGGRE